MVYDLQTQLNSLVSSKDDQSQPQTSAAGPEKEVKLKLKLRGLQSLVDLTLRKLQTGDNFSLSQIGGDFVKTGQCVFV